MIGLAWVIQAQQQHGEVRYDATLGADERERLGAHYTPMAWARRIVEQALYPMLFHPEGLHCGRCTPSTIIRDIQIIDPACGDGVFLDAGADILSALLFGSYRAEDRDISLADVRREVLANCIIGLDIDPGAIAASRERLGPEAELHCVDSLLDMKVRTRGRPTAFVGNPPFLGGMRIGSVLGRDYQQQLRRSYPYSKGGADLSSYFLMSAARDLIASRTVGTVGMVFTKTISQGVTREAALEPLLHSLGFWIYRAETNVPWPGEAAVSVSIVHLANKRLSWALWPEEMVKRAMVFPACFPDEPMQVFRDHVVHIQKPVRAERQAAP